MTGVSFSGHVTLLNHFLERRNQIIDDIERRLLNVQGKDLSRSRNRSHFEQALVSCFYDSKLPGALAQSKGQLSAAHIRDGFEPVILGNRSHQLDPVELIVRAYEYWENHRWPGRAGRTAFAHTLYAVFLLRQLELLSLRIWDEGDDRAGIHLHEIQQLLERLNDAATTDIFVRDARWLIQTALGPLTRQLEPYFTIAEQISASFEEADRIELHKAGAKLAGGHLRSQLRYRASEMQRSIDDPEVLSITRNSNSMDGALLVFDLVALLTAYKHARDRSDREERLALADAILQGLSADPELLLTRLDILGPCTMIEEVFVEAVSGRAQHTRFGETYLAARNRYAELVGDLAPSLKEDASSVASTGTAYSPYGVVYGFVADAMSNMAFDRLLSQPSFGLSLEDMFNSAGDLENKRSRARGWETLPTRAGEHEHFEHSIAWASQISRRLNVALEQRATHRFRQNASSLSSSRLFVLADTGTADDAALPKEIVRAQEHCVTSDLKRALANGTTAFPRSQIVSDRKEGRYLASAEIDGKWFGVSKVLLTTCICQGKDALITDVPDEVIDILRLTCPELLAAIRA